MELNAGLEAQAPNPESRPYELKPPAIERVVRFWEAGREYAVKHFLRPPTQAEWISYDAALGASVSATEQGIAFEDNRFAAMVALWDKIALRVEGYELSDGPFQGQVSAFHKIAAIEPLLRVWVTVPEGPEVGAVYRPGKISMALRCADHDFPLTHTLKRPSMPQEIALKRLQSVAMLDPVPLPSGERRTIVPSKLAEHCRIWDELVESVEGYVLDGQPLSREQAIAAMDAIHKQTALAGLFVQSLPAPSAKTSGAN